MPEAPETAGLDVELYADMQTRLRLLKSQFPTSSAENLAREVLRRIAQSAAEDVARAPGHGKIIELCYALIDDDDQAGARFIRDIRRRGTSVESIYLDYLAAAATMLGTWWEEDRASFAEVTVGTSRMYAIMRTLQRDLPTVSLKPGKSAIFATVPGEDHVLGVRMAADLFRKDGWDIDLKIGKTHDELVVEIGSASAVVIGLSASSKRVLESLSRLILALRIQNPSISIFVSGKVVEEHEETVGLLDVDGIASDYYSAKRLLEAHVAGR
jgi:methanogenic corrinoid protein MtbC1